MKHKYNIGDIVEIGDYRYTMSAQGWDVVVKDRNKTEYGEIQTEIQGTPVTHMSYTFCDCRKLVVTPKIPDSITDMFCTFMGCKQLTTAPAIPSSVTDMRGTFYSCKSLATPPDMSNANSVTDMKRTFSGCTSLVNPPDMSNANSVKFMHMTFANCTSLTTMPLIPDSVKVSKNLFKNCHIIEKEFQDSIVIDNLIKDENDKYVSGVITIGRDKADFVCFYENSYLELSDIPNPVPEKILKYQEWGLNKTIIKKIMQAIPK